MRPLSSPYVFIAAVVLCALTLATSLHEVRLNRLKASFLEAVPDSIPADPALMKYAMVYGRAGFLENCASCHGAAGRGDFTRGIPNLTDADWLYGSGRVGEIERIVLYGIRSGHSRSQHSADMPAFATPNPYDRYPIEPLTPLEVQDVAELIYSFQHKAAVRADVIARGDTVYHGKGLCFDCHSDHATGDPAVGAPNLTDSTWLYGGGSLDDIKAAVQWGLAGICPQWIARLPPEKIRAIAVYVYSLAPHLR